MRTSPRRDLVLTFALILLLTAAGLALWLNLVNSSQIIIAALVEAVRGNLVGLLPSRRP